MRYILQRGCEYPLTPVSGKVLEPISRNTEESLHPAQVTWYWKWYAFGQTTFSNLEVGNGRQTGQRGERKIKTPVTFETDSLHSSFHTEAAFKAAAETLIKKPQLKIHQRISSVRCLFSSSARDMAPNPRYLVPRQGDGNNTDKRTFKDSNNAPE